MTPREFLAEVVRPNVSEFHANWASLRHAFNAVMAVDALVAHMFVWCVSHRLEELKDINTGTAYREMLAHRDPAAYGLLRDVAKAQKHVRLDFGKPQISGAAQIRTRATGWGEVAWGGGRWDGEQQVVVDLDSGKVRSLQEIVDGALLFLEGEMARIGC